VAEKHIKKVGRFRAESPADHLEALSELRKKAKQQMIEQARPTNMTQESASLSF